MTERTGLDPSFVTSEIDRYTSSGGQALGYMVGALKIKELRERAQARLGTRCSITVRCHWTCWSASSTSGSRAKLRAKPWRHRFVIAALICASVIAAL